MNDFLQLISRKKPTILLNTKTANNLYKVVPTEATKFEWIRAMSNVQSHTPYIKYTAREPVWGLMKSVKMGVKAPVSQKLWSKTEKHIVVKFKDSLLFTEADLFTIAQAERDDARDAEVKEAAMAITANVEALKYKNQATKEKLYWEWLLWQMNVEQINWWVISNIEIPTNTRVITALTGTAVWTDHTWSSTADPVKDVRAMILSFKWKWMKLGKIKLNTTTYFNLLWVPKVRDYFKYTTVKTETSWTLSFVLWWIIFEVYDEGYKDADWVFQDFIPDGYIIGVWQASGKIDWNIVDYVECLNVDAKKPDSYAIEAVYGTHFRIKSTDDPVSTQFLISNFWLPVIKNPQLIVYQKVHS